MKKIAIISAIVLLFTIVIGIASFIAMKKLAHTNNDAPPKQTETSSNINNKNNNLNMSKGIIADIYVPTTNDKKAKAAFYVYIKNNTNRAFEGTFQLNTDLPIKESDKVGYIKLTPREAKFISASDKPITSNGPIDMEMTVSYRRGEAKLNSKLNYIITMSNSNGNGYYAWVYVPQSANDDECVAIAKEIKSFINDDVIHVKFTHVLVGPEEGDIFAVYNKYKSDANSKLTFYTTDNAITDPKKSKVERNKIDI